MDGFGNYILVEEFAYNFDLCVTLNILALKPKPVTNESDIKNFKNQYLNLFSNHARTSVSLILF